ncbi:putative glucan 1,3-beta-glucosidase precursor [Whalleya microplaca]|nr:putative glucan 1,3-beta-glucosidase precursor [Whalleya microplaca]
MLLSVFLIALVSAVLADTAPDISNPIDTRAPFPVGPPQPAPSYAKSNIDNQLGTAPDKGVLDGPVLGPLSSDFLHELHRHSPSLISISQNDSQREPRSGLADDDYWLAKLGPKGQMPFAPSGYQFFRNVQDFGAVGDGVTDDTAAINRAAAAMSQDNLDETRCGGDCGSTTTLGALIYFPPGTYVISSPIVQYYYTQFVGNPVNRPVIKGSTNFTGFALIDNNVYTPGGGGRQWYINQNNFLRQIRNLVFDMTGMTNENWQGDQQYVPTGIHWQVGQATSISNCFFNMTIADRPGGTTAIGIMMENGSGGVVSDLAFRGGNVGFFAGSQQFTANNLVFVSCLTAIKHPWNWGFLWKAVYMFSCSVAIDCSDYSGGTHQNTGSITVLDSVFEAVSEGIVVPVDTTQQPNIVLDNLQVANTPVVVQAQGGSTILAGTPDEVNIASWATGYQYSPFSGSGGSGSGRTGFIMPTTDKPEMLLNNGGYLTQFRPDYSRLHYEGTIVDATEHGVKNDATGDQSAAINTLLTENIGSVVFFPAGVYMVERTVEVPVGSRIVGSGWSQIMGTGSYFGDENSPKVMVRVGQEGDIGIMEISDMMFTVKAPSAGCILMEWNVHEIAQGSAILFDSHFRVGGAAGTHLQAADCPAFATAVDHKCMAATMLMHITTHASAYIHNAWLWVADHDIDNLGNAEAYESSDGVPVNANQTQISIYAGRGLLIESQGPVWLYGVSSEHAQLHQFSLHGASNIYMGHIQTETPYYQPNPNALEPYGPALDSSFIGDPTYNDCHDDRCRGAWALRIINSTNVMIYSAGFYSFFQNNHLGCTDTESCQLALVETSFSEGLWIYNLFTKGNVEIISPKGYDLLLPLLFNKTTRRGYTSEIAAWLVLAVDGGDQGIDPEAPPDTNSGPVLIDPNIWQPGIWQSSDQSVTISCYPPCTYVLPPVTLPSLTTISFPPSSTNLVVGWSTSVSFTGDDGNVTSTNDYVSTTIVTTLTIPPVTTSVIPIVNVPIPPEVNSTLIYPSWNLVAPPFVITDDPDIEGNGITHPPNTRTITPKPFPWSTFTMPTVSSISPAPGSSSSTSIGEIPTITSPPESSSSTDFALILPSITMTHTKGPPGPQCTEGCGELCVPYDPSKCPKFCQGDSCHDDGADCTGNDCTEGNDCASSQCTKGGSCKGPSCTHGGNCWGPWCKIGGGCFGPFCIFGGLCNGLLCEHGGDCEGPLCIRGGGCGPFGCPPGRCIGALCGIDDSDSDFHDSNDPDRQVPDPEDCTTRTYSSCRSSCVASPTHSCTSTCSDVYGCDTMGTSFASTITPAPINNPDYLDTWNRYDDSFQDQVSVAQGIISLLNSLGDFSTMGNPPASSSQTPSPSPSPTAVDPPTRPTAYVEIAEGGSNGADCNWYIFAKRSGETVDFCRPEEFLAKIPFDCGSTLFPLPNGEYVLPSVADLGMEDCVYKGTVYDVGTLNCANWPAPVNCRVHQYEEHDCSWTTMWDRVQCLWG